MSVQHSIRQSQSSNQQVATRALSLTPASRFAIVTVGGALLTALAAQVKFPLLWSPIPVTLQTLAVLAIGVYGSRFSSPAAAVASQLAYLGLGIAGVPVFALAFGLSLRLGYLLAFPAAIGIASLAARARMPFAGRVLALSFASALILASGGIWLGWVTQASLAEAIAFGIAPFVLVEAAKVALVSLTLARTAKT